MRKTPIQERTSQLSTLQLNHGGHKSWDQGHCALEVVSWLAGEEHGDHPVCTCPVLARFVRSWNDGLPDDEARTRLLRPLLPRLVGTRSTTDVERARSELALRWLVQVQAAGWLRAAGLTAHADALAAVGDPRGSLAAIRAARAAAWDAAKAASIWAAASAAAKAAAWDAARAAAGDAARDTAWYAAGDAAWYAAWYAAWAAAGDALAPTVTALQASAVALIGEMIAIGAEE